MVEGVVHREHPAPRLADDRVPVGDAEVPGELGELVLEQPGCPEVGGRVGQELALAAAELVVEDAGAAEPAQVGDRLAVVVRGTGAAVADDDGRLRCARVELTHDAVPGLVAAPLHPSFVVCPLPPRVVDAAPPSG